MCTGYKMNVSLFFIPISRNEFRSDKKNMKLELPDARRKACKGPSIQVRCGYCGQNWKKIGMHQTRGRHRQANNLVSLKLNIIESFIFWGPRTGLAELSVRACQNSE